MIKTTKHKRAIKFRFSSTVRNLEIVINEGKLFLSQIFSDVSFSDFEIVSSELLVNALVHGNQKNPEKKISFEITLVKNSLVKLVVKDEGHGFDWSHLDFEIPADPKNIKKRGYLLINALTESMTFEDNGSKVIIFLLIKT